MDTGKKIKTWMPLGVALSIALGIFIGNQFSIFNRIGKIQGTEKLDAVLDYIKDSYVDTIKINNLVEDALPNIVHELDPHSVYIPADEMKRVDEDLGGYFSGIGVSFYVLRDTVTVTSIIHGGPSEAAGILPGDRIIKVNDSLFVGKNITNDKVFKTLRGEKGTEITLSILRSPKKTLTNITVTRGNIPTSSVQASYMLTEDVGYIKVGTFAYNTFSEFISAISKLKKEGCCSFVVDLRGNSGGSLETVVAMVNEFLNKGDLIVYAEGRKFPRTDDYANGTGTCQTDNLVVLIDEMSASASEIFAGAVQDHDRGLIIGRRSFGKGLVQSQRRFYDGSAIRLTVARYYTPSGRSIQRKYKKGHYTEYEMDAVSRYVKGNYINVDTLGNNNLKPFKTESGRIVYGGDGIMPDIFVPRDTTGINSYYNTLVNKNLVLEYAMLYGDANREKLNKFETWRELNLYLKKQPLLLNLVSYADSQGVRRRPYYISASRDLLESLLRAYIIRSFAGEEGFYSVILENDNLIKDAVKLIISGDATPKAISNHLYTKIEKKLQD